MAEAKGFPCRHCGRPIVVPASKCPWCGEQIMVICSSCKAYTDDQKENCDHCGAPLQPDRKERLALHAHHPEIARMVEDRARAQLVASTVVINHQGDFFYDDGQGRQTVLVTLLGSGDKRAVAAGVVFSAYAYLCQHGYCTLRARGSEEDVERLALSRLRPWDGQKSLEGTLVEEMVRASTTYEATSKVLRGAMGFRVMAVGGSTLRQAVEREAPERSPLAAIDQVARLTELPEGDPVEACRVTYQMLLAFVDADREAARLLAVETVQLLGVFETYL